MPDSPPDDEDDADLAGDSSPDDSGEEEDSLEFELSLEPAGSDSDVHLVDERPERPEDWAAGAGAADRVPNEVEPPPSDTSDEGEPLAAPPHQGVPFIDLTEVTVPQSVIDLIPESVAREACVLPLAQENSTLRIAIGEMNASGRDTVQKLQFILNREIQPVLAPRHQIIEAINRHYGQTQDESVDSMLQEFTDTAIDFYESSAGVAADDDTDSPIARLVDLIIREAISLGSSEIHIEPLTDRARIRYRLGNVMVERDSPPRRLLAPIVSRIKRLGRLDLTERRHSQAGRFKMSHNGTRFGLRVRILPTHHGESAVLHIADPRNIEVSIRDLGFGEEDNKRFQQIIKRPNGLVLLTGPPNSGKTTTWYVALNELNRPDRKIITLEDSIEYDLAGMNQWQISGDQTFADALRHVLRQVPDVIGVREMRDVETAQLAVHGSLAGCLVLGTLSTADNVASALARLNDFGVPPVLVAGSVTAVLSQRLIQIVCGRCKEPDQPDAVEIQAGGITPDQLARATFMRGRGCNHCRHTGYRGWTGIFELLTMNSALRELASNRAPPQEIRRQARLQGRRTLVDDAIEKALKGITTLDEVIRVCRHEIEAGIW